MEGGGREKGIEEGRMGKENDSVQGKTELEEYLW